MLKKNVRYFKMSQDIGHHESTLQQLNLSTLSADRQANKPR